ncbi:MAG: ABC transporter permease [Bacteroidales bacterium]|nr:ABC transporter permease [Bacteroidales bacterium]
MSKTTDKNRRHNWFVQLGLAFRREWTMILDDVGVMLFFIALPLVYPVVYTLIYNPEIVTKMPIAVVDNSCTPSSRTLVRSLEASPSVAIYDYCTDMGEAKDLFASQKVFGILEIPSDYEKKIVRGEQATVPFYAEVSLLLRYRAYLSALTDLQLKLASDITMTRLQATGVSALGISGLPVNTANTFLGDPGQGFASFVMPGIVILILQQSMVLGICFISGTSRERRRRFYGTDPMMLDDLSASAIVWGKALCYVIFYIPLTIYVVRYIPEIFGLPHQGDPVDYLLFIFPLLLSTAMFGQTVQYLCKERESAFPIIVFTSVLFLFLSGLTWPRYAMNDFWTWMGNLVPATWGVEGFIRINSNGATLAESARPYIAMWILTGIYFLTAWWVTATIRRRSIRRYGPLPDDAQTIS